MEDKNQAGKAALGRLSADTGEKESPGRDDSKGTWVAPELTRISGNDTESKYTGGFEAGSFGPLS